MNPTTTLSESQADLLAELSRLTHELSVEDVRSDEIGKRMDAINEHLKIVK